MSRVIQFFNENQNLISELTDAQKAELCILYDRCPSGLFRPKPQVNFQLTIDEVRYKPFLKLMYPLSQLPSLAELDSIGYTFETEYAKKIGGYQYNQNYYKIYSKEDPGYLTHQIMFDTNFGETDITLSPKDRIDVIKALKDFSKTNYWPNDYTTYLTWIGECGISLKCINSDLDQKEKQQLKILNESTVTIDTYKAILIYELYLLA